MKADSRSCTLPTWNRFYQLSSLHDCLNQLIGWGFFLSLFFPCELLLLKVEKKKKGKRPGYRRQSGANNNNDNYKSN